MNSQRVKRVDIITGTKMFLRQNNDDPTAMWVAGRLLGAWNKKTGRSGMVMIIFTVGTVAAFAFYVFNAFSATEADKEAFQKYDTQTVASISEIETKKESTGEHTERDTCQITYAYDVDGKEYEETLAMFSHKLCRWDVGDSIAVTYDSANPSVSSIQEKSIQEARTLPWRQMFFGVLLLGFMGFALYKHYKRQKFTKEIQKNAPAYPYDPQAVPRLAFEFTELIAPGAGSRALSDNEVRQALRYVPDSGPGRPDPYGPPNPNM